MCPKKSSKNFKIWQNAEMILILSTSVMSILSPPIINLLSEKN